MELKQRNCKRHTLCYLVNIRIGDTEKSAIFHLTASTWELRNRFNHGVAGSNPAGGEILPEPKRRFIAQSLSCSPFHRLEMTEILLEGRKTLTHPSIHPFQPIRFEPSEQSRRSAPNPRQIFFMNLSHTAYLNRNRAISESRYKFKSV